MPGRFTPRSLARLCEEREQRDQADDEPEHPGTAHEPAELVERRARGPPHELGLAHAADLLALDFVSLVVVHGVAAAQMGER